MPRNSSGVMVLPAGNPVIPGTLIESTWANPTMTDLANEITASLPRNGTAPMTGPLILARDGILPKEATTVDQLNGAIAGSSNYLSAGAIQYFAMVAIPSGWLEANGAEVSRTTYANLFATIGTVFGTGNGTTTFNLPDLRGTFIRGFDNGRSIDPGRAFGSSQAGSNAAHSHTVTDPTHTHGASQPAHSHAVTDPGHSHSIDLGTGEGGALRAGSNQGSDSTDVSTLTSATGVSVQSSQPGISVNFAYSGVSVGASGGEARPVNLALVACIKAFGALQTDGLGTMAFQNKDAVSITGGVGVFSSLQCTKAPTEPNDVARLSDVGGVNEVYSADIQTIVVDSTDPMLPVIRPQTNVANGLAKLNSSGQIPASLIPISDVNYQGPWDASTGNTPSQTYPLVTFSDGDAYQISVLGTLTVYGSNGIAAPTSCVVGSSIIYVSGSPTFPNAGWYYNPPVSFSGAAASGISFTPVGGITSSNVQDMGEELDTDKAPKDTPIFTGPVTIPQDINITEPYCSLHVEGVEVMRTGGANGDNSGQLAGFRQKLINATFQINQRGYVSGATLLAGVYGHDRWKAGASGGNYTFTQLKSATQINIEIGRSLIQVIEDFNVEGGVYALAWIGTAQARVGLNGAVPSGAYLNSPILITGQLAGVALSVEFANNGPGGTLFLPQTEPGSIPSLKEIRPIGFELALCQRYLPAWKSSGVSDFLGTGQAYGAANAWITLPLPVAPRVKPTGILTSSSTYCSVFSATGTTLTCSSLTFAGSSSSSITISTTSAAALVVGNATTMYFNNSGGFILVLGCEL